MKLSYLDLDSKFINKEKLLALKDERDTWIDRPSNKEYKDLLNNLPKLKAKFSDFENSEITLGHEDEIPCEQREEILSQAKALIPWRKGPFRLFGELIDAEWRSDFKWERLEKSLGSLKDKKVLDIGCNNGYFMFRMAAQNPELVLGIDPVVHNLAQFEFINHFSQLDNLKFELFGVEHLTYFRNYWDTIFSMGILYHHRHPMEQLIQMREALAPEGQLILETIGIPGDETVALFPEDKYAKMRNVWFLPTLSCLKNWANRAGFIDIEVLSVQETTFDEQRLTKWCPPPHQSLQDFLDQDDPTKTVEGYPAPVRFCLKMKKKKGPLLGVE
ncbi:tRNA 5-methoxyuridine(34)/uridine 5-oxyacetic acid(34) synthase CmoB [Halobacteriovorax sp. GB3]|uniref:tRNA 5-methoxyuridine(34)/uridine 5-oxyacetic acid(34) synthase CmoB n=1 Tax=Halobacteriovorax sp. GB3 TaxID=2719615 RepID=UPI002362C0AF|nr:tRNA 5-methoxyuridine(34)/uridine 5-oxyacetic acid(34) synthase CmoB [Halobacteriovorax sp. GB3]MDD0851933.1 tRNA 5-methoxyuridine(34)/uridine 5-oxyacetic acid(34) synthase CmoB [Halobacteriovorax sp. GB3]